MITYALDSLPSPIFLEPWDLDYFLEVTTHIKWDETEGWWVEDYA